LWSGRGFRQGFSSGGGGRRKREGVCLVGWLPVCVRDGIPSSVPVWVQVFSRVDKSCVRYLTWSAAGGPLQGNDGRVRAPLACVVAEISGHQKELDNELDEVGGAP
jgi:hypothetical protein